MVDSDGDGLLDCVETHGIMDNLSHVYCIGPNNPDTDGDGIDDPDEAEFSTGMLDWDSDNDGLGDGFELEIVTEPLIKDTDFDGYNDYEEYHDPDHDPLVYEKRYSYYEIAREFTLGAVLGEFGYDDHDSFYYLAGHIVSGVFAIGDVRDMAASISNGDLVGILLNAFSVVPLYGDATKIATNVGEFVLKHGDEAGIVAVKCASFMPAGTLSEKTILAAVKGKTDDLISLGFADDDIIKLAKKGINPAKFNDAIKNVDAFDNYPGLNAFLKKQLIDDTEDKAIFCTFNVKKAANRENIPAGYQSYVDKYINNLKGAYTEDLLAKHIGGDEVVVGLSHVNKGGIDYAGRFGNPPHTLKIGEAKAVQSLSMSKLENYIKRNDITGELEFNQNYARKEIGDAYLKNPSIQKEFVLYINGPDSAAIKTNLISQLGGLSEVPYKYKDAFGQDVTEYVKITVKAVNE